MEAMHVAMGCVALGFVFYTLMAIRVYKMLIETKPQRIAARRAYKRRRNMALAKMYGIKYDPDRKPSE